MTDSLRLEEIEDSIRDNGIANQRKIMVDESDLKWLIYMVEKSLEGEKV